MIDNQIIEQEFTRLRKWPQLKKRTDDEVRLIAKRNLIEKQFPILSNLKKDERKTAFNLVHRYFEEFTIENISDQQTLADLVFHEIVQHRLQERFERHYEKDDKAIPTQLLESIHTNSDRIRVLKDMLGLKREKQETSDVFKTLETLKKRFKLFRQQNPNRTFKCPHCGKFALLKIRTDCYDTQKHPFFKDNVLFNDHLLKLYNEKRITEEDVAKILNTSNDYVKWIIARINKSQVETMSSDETSTTESQSDEQSKRES